MENKVEIEEYIEDGEIHLRWANGILIFSTPKGQEILAPLTKPK